MIESVRAVVRKRNFYRCCGKRMLDVVIAVSALVALSPALLLLSLLVLITVGRPVIFRQKRLGLDCTEFTLYKFRTMSNRRDIEGVLLPDAQRVTKLGAWLRRTSLDELPELWNILVGEMSLVGPRPLVVHYRSRYTPDQLRRQSVRPGLTGLAQTYGRNVTTWDERFQYDTHYVDGHDFLLDMKIIIRTAAVVLEGDGGVDVAWQLGEYMGPDQPPNKSGIVSTTAHRSDVPLNTPQDRRNT